MPAEHVYDQPLGADASGGLASGDSNTQHRLILGAAPTYTTPQPDGGPAVHGRVYTEPIPVDPSATYSSTGASDSLGKSPPPPPDRPPSDEGPPDRPPSDERPPSPVYAAMDYEDMHNRSSTVLGSFLAPLPPVAGGGDATAEAPSTAPQYRLFVGDNPTYATPRSAASAASAATATYAALDGTEFVYATVVAAAATGKYRELVDGEGSSTTTTA